MRKVPLPSMEISPTNGGAIDVAYFTVVNTRGVKSSSAAAWYCSTRAYSKIMLKHMWHGIDAECRADRHSAKVGSDAM